MASSCTLSLSSPSSLALSSQFSNPKGISKVGHAEIFSVSPSRSLKLKSGKRSIRLSATLSKFSDLSEKISERASTADKKAESATSGLDKVATSAVALLAAVAILATTPGEAMAASSSGRVGGSTFRAKQSVRVENSRTEIYVNPSPTVIVAAPPVIIAPAPVYGFVPAVPYGGWAPFSFGPTFVVSGSSFLTFFLATMGIGLVFALVSSFSNRRDDYY